MTDPLLPAPRVSGSPLATLVEQWRKEAARADAQVQEAGFGTPAGFMRDMEASVFRQCAQELADALSVTTPPKENEQGCVCHKPDYWGYAGQPLTWWCLTCGRRPSTVDRIHVRFVKAAADAPAPSQGWQAIATQLTASLGWALRHLRAHISFGEDGDAFSRHNNQELAGFVVKWDEAEAAYKAGLKVALPPSPPSGAAK